MEVRELLLEQVTERREGVELLREGRVPDQDTPSGVAGQGVEARELDEEDFKLRFERGRECGKTAELEQVLIRERVQRGRVKSEAEMGGGRYRLGFDRSPAGKPEPRGHEVSGACGDSRRVCRRRTARR